MSLGWERCGSVGMWQGDDSEEKTADRGFER